MGCDRSFRPRAAGRPVRKMPVFNGQDSVEFFDEFQEFLTVLFHRDKGTKFVDAVIVFRLHGDSEVLQYSL